MEKMGPPLPCPSLELRVIRAVMVINNDKETVDHAHTITINIIITILLLLYGLLFPQVWEALIISV